MYWMSMRTPTIGSCPKSSRLQLMAEFTDASISATTIHIATPHGSMPAVSRLILVTSPCKAMLIMAIDSWKANLKATTEPILY